VRYSPIDWFFRLRKRLSARSGGEIERSDHHPFRTQEGRDRYFAALDARARRWPQPSETRTVETSWARTFVRVNGPIDGPPLLLLHGSATNSLSWEPNVAALSASFRTYAVDNPWDIGRSVYKRDATRSDDYLAWLDELLDALQITTPIALAGMSYGAWLSSLYALRRPGRVRKLVLLSPALTVRNVRLVWVVRALLSMLTRSLSEQFARWTLADGLAQGPYERTLVEEVRADAFAFAKDLVARRAVLPTVLSDEALATLPSATLILIGAHEKIFDPLRARARARSSSGPALRHRRDRRRRTRAAALSTRRGQRARRRVLARALSARSCARRAGRCGDSPRRDHTAASAAAMPYASDRSIAAPIGPLDVGEPAPRSRRRFVSLANAGASPGAAAERQSRADPTAKSHAL
jgi:pimeloyl-ACP methyl ester carboxylesterase